MMAKTIMMMLKERMIRIIYNVGDGKETDYS